MEEEGAGVGRLSSPLQASPYHIPKQSPRGHPVPRPGRGGEQHCSPVAKTAGCCNNHSGPLLSLLGQMLGRQPGRRVPFPPTPSLRAWGKPCREGALLLTWHWGGQEALQLQKNNCNLMLGRSTAALPHIWFSAKLPQLNNRLSESAAALEFYSGEGEMDISLL